ncbi:MAG TPA: TerB family tellurite resistance protein [Rhodothermales bacterium]|nr:TerB family tellurite resistance protein [Rhodothermales bacterium]
MLNEDHNELELTHNLALLYLSLAHGVDENLSYEERESMVVKLRRWLPDKDPAYIGHVIREAMLTYFEGIRQEQLTEIAETLGSALSRDRLATVLDDLRDIASADDTITEAEERFIARVAAVWGLEGEKQSSL